MLGIKNQSKAAVQTKNPTYDFNPAPPTALMAARLARAGAKQPEPERGMHQGAESNHQHIFIYFYLSINLYFPKPIEKGTTPIEKDNQKARQMAGTQPRLHVAETNLCRL
jgi:hypothetical protein